MQGWIAVCQIRLSVNPRVVVLAEALLAGMTNPFPEYMSTSVWTSIYSLYGKRRVFQVALW